MSTMKEKTAALIAAAEAALNRAAAEIAPIIDRARAGRDETAEIEKTCRANWISAVRMGEPSFEEAAKRDLDTAELEHSKANRAHLYLTTTAADLKSTLSIMGWSIENMDRRAAGLPLKI